MKRRRLTGKSLARNCSKWPDSMLQIFESYWPVAPSHRRPVASKGLKTQHKNTTQMGFVLHTLSNIHIYIYIWTSYGPPILYASPCKYVSDPCHATRFLTLLWLHGQVVYLRPPKVKIFQQNLNLFLGQLLDPGHISIFDDSLGILQQPWPWSKGKLSKQMTPKSYSFVKFQKSSANHAETWPKIRKP